MRVKAIKVAEGFLIPFEAGLNSTLSGHILLDIELVEQSAKLEDYTALDELVGLCKTENTTASVDHDHQIYNRKP